MPWTPDDISDQTGRIAIVTGANSGIGFHTAAHLAAKGATVLLACRNTEKANAARERIRTAVPDSTVVVSTVDLADLSSIEQFADRTLSTHASIDLLINNAGIMIPPYGTTVQGHELQFGTNHLGHFALTGRLLPGLLNSPESRVVTVASTANRFGRIDFDDLNHQKRYIPWEAYGQSKLANLLFGFELSRRLESHHPALLSTVAHPGFTSTAITRQSWWMPTFTPMFGQNPDLGSWPTLRAATDATAGPGSYWGPRWFFELWGAPVKVSSSRASRDTEAAARLWAISEKLTGVRYLSDS